MVGGGDGHIDKAYGTVCTLLHHMNCYNIHEAVYSHNTNIRPAISDEHTLMGLNSICDFLAYLKDKDIRTGVISNISYAPSVVAERINRLLPENTFEFIITSSNYIFRKPNKRIFDLALEKAQLQPNEVWYIGDQYECDVKGSLNAGLLPIWYIGAIDLPYTADKNILTAKTWSEVERYMEG